MKKIVLIFIGAFTMTSCSDFLEETPKSSMAVESFFTKPEHAHSAVNLLYRRGVPSFGNAFFWSCPHFGMGPFMSGFFDSPYKGQERFYQHATELALTPTEDSDKLDIIWGDSYYAIYHANLAIERIPGTPNLTDAERNQLLAQARFFRALNYFHLVKSFGEVPLITDTNSTEYIVPKNSLTEVYNLIVGDLKSASEQGGLNDVPMCKNGFRISKGSVNTLLADVYLTMSGQGAKIDKYAEAAAVARQIINSGNYKLISNVDKTTGSAYNVMRNSDIQDEYMYQIERTPGISINRLGMACYPQSVEGVLKQNGYKYATTVNVFIPKPELIAIYDKAEDIRIQEKQFFHSSYVAPNGTIYPFENGMMLPYLWHDDKGLFVDGQPEQDMKIYRYAEVLLIAAEAIAQKEGVTDEAAGYLAQVRSRASLTDKSVTTIKIGLLTLSKQAFIEEVWKERLREFPFEWKIWDDMVRTGKYPKTDLNNPGSIVFQTLVGSSTTYNRTFAEKDLLFPISQNEIQRNPKLTQNKGY